MLSTLRAPQLISATLQAPEASFYAKIFLEKRQTSLLSVLK